MHIYTPLYTGAFSVCKGKVLGEITAYNSSYIVDNYRATVSGFKGKSYKVLGVYKDGVAD